MAVFVLWWPGLGTWQGLEMVVWLRLEVEEEELEEGQASTEGSRFIPIRLWGNEYHGYYRDSILTG